MPFYAIHKIRGRQSCALPVINSPKQYVCVHSVYTIQVLQKKINALIDFQKDARKGV